MRVCDKVWFRKEWTIPSELGQEKNVIAELRRTFQELQLEEPFEPCLDEMVTAVSEACLNAIEHGNQLIKDLPVNVILLIQSDRYTFQITDRGNGIDIVDESPGAQVRDRFDWENPRGWGLLLIRHYADLVRELRYDGEFCIELHFLRMGAKGAAVE
ncbi:MAG: hypothetical protein K0R67_1158 [Paenibacillus sp.]|jgi:serine/threonine-protein kinase RsbW|nr:hypothetical protein [Paenibacillus sp.]